MKKSHPAITGEAPRRSSEDLTTQPREFPNPPPVSPGTPDICLPSRSPLAYVCLATVGMAILMGLGLLFWRVSSSEPSPAPVPRVMSDEERLCNRFAEIKNAGDPAANALLPPKPDWPEKAVGQREGDRLQADLFLREVVRIESVRAQRGPAGDTRFILATQGNVAAPPLSVRTAKDIERSQRTMTNPEIIVEVRGGTIHALRAQLGS
jgi:hypothetical protein